MSLYRTYQRTVTAARVLLLITSVAGAGFLIVWFRVPAIVDAVDETLRERHLAPHRQRLQDAKSAAEDGDLSTALSHLEAARQALRPVRKGDRLDPLKRQTYRRLATAYHDADQEDAAFGVLDEWSAFDPRDVNPIVLRAEWLGVAGFEILRDLRIRFPHAQVAGLFPPQTLPDTLSGVDALVLAADTLTLPPNPKWQIYWDDGNGFRGAASQIVDASIAEDGAFILDTAVPGDVRRLRLDGPSSSILVHDLSIHLEGSDTTITLPLHEASPRHQVRNVAPRTLEMAGQDPQIHVPIPASFHREEGVSVTIHGWVITAPHPRLLDLLASQEAASIIDAIEYRGDTGRARLLRQTRQWLQAPRSELAPEKPKGDRK